MNKLEIIFNVSNRFFFSTNLNQFFSSRNRTVTKGQNTKIKILQVFAFNVSVKAFFIFIKNNNFISLFILLGKLLRIAFMNLKQTKLLNLNHLPNE